MTTTLSNHGPSARPVNGFEEDPFGEDDPCEARLRGLSRHLDPDPDDDLDPAEDPVPVCARCGSGIGIFLKFGLQWRHYRGGDALGQLPVYSERSHELATSAARW
jgi:hypothetical protein